MAFVRNPLCKTCNIILAESPGNPRQSAMYKMIERSRKGEVSLADVARAYEHKDISYESVTVHSKKHQVPGDTLPKQLAYKNAIRKDDRSRLDDLEKKLDTVLSTLQKRNIIIDAGMEQIQSGQVKIPASVTVKALKDADDIEAKKTDQSLDMMKMFNKYVSGEIADPKAMFVEGEVIE